MTTTQQTRTNSRLDNFDQETVSAVSDLADQVAAGYASAARSELSTLRDALTAAVRHVEQALEPALELEKLGLTACVERVRSASDASAQLKIEEADAAARVVLAAKQADIERHLQRNEELTAQIEALGTEISSLKADVATQKRQIAAAEASAARIVSERDAEVAARRDAAAALKTTMDELRVAEEQHQRLSEIGRA